MKKTYFFTIIFLFLILALSCNHCNNTSNATDNLKDIKLDTNDTVNVKIHRYEKALFAVDINNIKNDLQKLLPEYSFFIPDSALSDSLSLLQMKSYLSDPLIINIYDDCIKLYPDLTDLEAQLNKALSLYKHYFPEKKTPEVYTCVSGLYYEEPVHFADSILVISLDMYMGSDYKYYKEMLGLPLYIQKRFRKDFILADCMRAIAETLVDNSKESKNFLDYITYEGKLLYFMDATLPDTPDSIKMYYSPSQLLWCQDNEANIWSFIIDRKLMYSTDATMISKLCSDGPFTAVFSKESPSRTGIWTGWQIIRKYMEENKDVTLSELFMNQDAQSILTLSKYKPKK
jgi:hypothetical protein